jgi:hypothetical protein
MRNRMTIQEERALSRAPRMLVLVSLLALCACIGANRTMAEPAPPPGATLPYPSTGPLMTAALLTLADLRSRLQARYEPPWDAHRYAIPAATPWDSVIEHYERELGPNWHVDTNYAETSGHGYRSMVWTDGKHVVAIALNEAPQTNAEHALTVMFSAMGL